EIISPDDRLRLVALFAARSVPVVRRDVHLLTGCLACGACGAVMAHNRTRYTCACGRVGISARQAEAWVLAEMDSFTAWLADVPFDGGGVLAPAFEIMRQTFGARRPSAAAPDLSALEARKAELLEMLGA